MDYTTGDFIKNKKPYDGEGEYLVVGYTYFKNGDVQGYKCAMMKGKHCKKHDFDNHFIIHLSDEISYKKVG